MKINQSIFCLATIIGTILSVAACSNEDTVATNGNRVPLELQVNGVQATRSIIEGTKLPEECQYGIFAMNGYGESVIDNGSNVRVNYVKGISTLSKNVYLPSGVDVPVYAYYPYDANNSSVEYLIEMPIDVTTQTDYLYGYSADNDYKLKYVKDTEPKANIYFKHAMARVTMRIKKAADNENTYNLSYISLLNIDKRGYLNIMDNGAIRDISETANIMTKPSEHTLENSNNEIIVDFLVIPGNTEGKNIMLNLNGDESSDFKNGLSVAVPTTNWQSGQQYTYTVTIDNKKININEATITPWYNNEQGELNVGNDNCIGKEKITFEVNGVKFNMIRVEAGTFMMGATEEQVDYLEDEKPVHQVTLTHDYYIGETEVTQELWQAVMGTATTIEEKNLPQTGVDVSDQIDFINNLNKILEREFCLPTEAEWEYAARGGNKSKGYVYSGSDNIDEVAWHGGNSNDKTHPVATKQPNELGIYDMSGNVFEWCRGSYTAYSKTPQINPCDFNATAGIIRGGSYWKSLGSSYCRVSCRRSYGMNGHYGYLGLRLVWVP